jgi:hypothetical protein
LLEPPVTVAIINRAATLAADMAHWRSATIRADGMRGTGEDEATYAVAWTLSGLATLAVIVAIWIFAI